jgi:uncharacterized membrane protein
MKSLLHLAGRLLTTVALVAGCRSSEPTPRAAEPAAAATPPAAIAPLAAYVFECEGGTSFVLAMNKGGPGADEAVDLVLPDRRYRLPRVVAASGVHYAAGDVSVWNKGREATLEVDGRVSRCVENRRRSIVEDARARGVEFRGSGNEPGWVLELLADRMIFIDAYGARRASRRTVRGGDREPPPHCAAAPDAASSRLAVRIRPRPCIDSMSGARHGSGVEVELDGVSYRGCGDALPR